MNTTYFLNMIMGNVFGSKTTPPLSSEYYIALSFTDGAKDGSGITEPSIDGTGYTRMKADCFSEPQNGVITNTDKIEWPTALTDIGVIGYYGIYDAETGGNLLIYGNLDKPKTIEENTVFSIPKDSLVLTLKDIPGDAV